MSDEVDDMDEDENIEICEWCGFPITYIPWLDCDMCPGCTPISVLYPDEN